MSLSEATWRSCTLQAGPFEGKACFLGDDLDADPAVPVEPGVPSRCQMVERYPEPRRGKVWNPREAGIGSNPVSTMRLSGKGPPIRRASEKSFGGRSAKLKRVLFSRRVHD